MRIDRSLLRWGVFLITLGAVPLAVRSGFLDTDVVRHAWELWPLILVGIGLGLVLKRTQVAVVGGLVVAITFGLMGGSLLAVGIDSGFTGLSGCGLDTSSAGTAFPARSGPLAGPAGVTLDLSCGELVVTTAPGQTWSLTGTDDRGRGPNMTARNTSLEIRSGNRGSFGIMQPGEHWQLQLPTDPAYASLDVSVNAGSARLSLGDASIADVSVSVNAGDAQVDLSRVASLATIDASSNAGSLKISLPDSSVTGSISSNVGSLDICVPAGVGIRLEQGDNALSGNNFAARGLVRDGGAWTSAGYAAAQSRIDLDVSANLGAVNLNPEAGCD